MPIYSNIVPICENCMPKTWPHEKSRMYNAIRFITNLKIKIRDKRTCSVCGSKKEPTVHHIFSKKEYPELEWNFNNMITLCKKCHEEYNMYEILFELV